MSTVVTKSVAVALVSAFLVGGFSLSALAYDKVKQVTKTKCVHHKICVKGKCHQAKSCTALAVDHKGKPVLLHSSTQSVKMK